MAQTFNITAKIQLQGPANIRPVVAAIQQQLSGINAQVNVKVSPSSASGVSSLIGQFSVLNANIKATQGAAAATAGTIKNIKMPQGILNATASIQANLNAAQTSVKSLGKSIQDTSSVIQKFGERVGIAARYFVAFQLGAVILSKLQAAFSDATRQGLQFQKTLAGLSQIGASADEIGQISSQITSLSKNLGVASEDLANTTIVLKGAGLAANEMKTALEALAKTSLTPTFGSLKETTEGLIALRQQFGVTANDFETYLGSINVVARQFAAESEDLVTAIRRAGGAFKAASSDATSSQESFQQFISIFTSIRATTRESADEISTGLRTIFARIQSNQVAEQLKGLGINLRYTAEEASLAGKNIEGQFVGAAEAVRRLQEAVKGVPTTDPRFAAIVNQIGGFRQISRVIPLLQQQTLQQKAYAAAQAGTNSLTQDAVKVQDLFLTKITKVKEEFNSLIRSLGENKSLQKFANVTLDLTSGLIKLAGVLQPLIPLMIAFAGIKVAQNITSFVPSVVKGFTQKDAIKRQSGGYVPGSGTGDIVPAMLEPGEYILNKKVTKKLGPQKLKNLLHYEDGGQVADKKDEKSKEARDIVAEKIKKLGGMQMMRLEKKHTGGKIPALLEPGEYVYTKQEAQSIGYQKLEAINKGQDTPVSARDLVASKIKKMGGMSRMYLERHAEGGIAGNPSISELLRHADPKIIEEMRRLEEEARKSDPLGQTKKKSSIGKADEHFKRANSLLFGGTLKGSKVSSLRSGSVYDEIFAKIQEFYDKHGLNVADVDRTKVGRAGAKVKAQRKESLETEPQHNLLGLFEGDVSDVSTHYQIDEHQKKFNDAIKTSTYPKEEAQDLIAKSKIIAEKRSQELLAEGITREKGDNVDTRASSIDVHAADNVLHHAREQYSKLSASNEQHSEGTSYNDLVDTSKFDPIPKIPDSVDPSELGFTATEDKPIPKIKKGILRARSTNISQETPIPRVTSEDIKAKGILEPRITKTAKQAPFEFTHIPEETEIGGTHVKFGKKVIPRDITPHARVASLIANPTNFERPSVSQAALSPKPDVEVAPVSNVKEKKTKTSKTGDVVTPPINVDPIVSIITDAVGELKEINKHTETTAKAVVPKGRPQSKSEGIPKDALTGPLRKELLGTPQTPEPPALPPDVFTIHGDNDDNNKGSRHLKNQKDLNFIDLPPLFPAHDENKALPASFAVPHSGTYPLGFENAGLPSTRVNRPVPNIISQPPIPVSEIPQPIIPPNISKDTKDDFQYTQGGSYALGNINVKSEPINTSANIDTYGVSDTGPTETPRQRITRRALERRRSEVAKQRAIIDKQKQDLESTNKAADAEEFNRASNESLSDINFLSPSKPIDPQREVDARLAQVHETNPRIAERASRLALQRQKGKELSPQEPYHVDELNDLSSYSINESNKDRPRIKSTTPFSYSFINPDDDNSGLGPVPNVGGKRLGKPSSVDNTIPLLHPDDPTLRTQEEVNPKRIGSPESHLQDSIDKYKSQLESGKLGKKATKTTKEKLKQAKSKLEASSTNVIPKTITNIDPLLLDDTIYTSFKGSYQDELDKSEHSRIARQSKDLGDRLDLIDLGVLPSNVLGKVNDNDLLQQAVGSSAGRTQKRYGSIADPRDFRGPVEPPNTPRDFDNISNVQDIPIEPNAKAFVPPTQREKIGLFGKVTRETVPVKSTARLKAEQAVRDRRSQPVVPLSIKDKILGRSRLSGENLQNLPDDQRTSILDQAQELFDPDLVDKIRGGKGDVTLSRSGNVVAATSRYNRKKGKLGTGLGLVSSAKLKLNDIKGQISNIGNTKTGQVAGLGVSTAALFSPTLLEHTYGTVDKPAVGQTRETAAKAQAVGGALQTGAVGAQLGAAVGGPIGAGLGALAGAAYGYATTLKDANNRIKELDFEESFKSFQAALEDVANGHGKFDQRSQSIVAAGLGSVNTEARRSVEANNSAGNFFDRNLKGTFIGNALDYQGNGKGSFSSSEADLSKQQSKLEAEKRIELLSPQLPAFHQIGQRIASDVTLTREELTPKENASQADLLAQKSIRRNKFDEAGGSQIAQTISEIQNIPIDQVYESFDKMIVSANALRIQEESQAKSVASANIELQKFTQIEQAVNAATNALHSLQNQSEHLADEFNGTISTSHIGNFSAGAGQIGGLDQNSFGRSLDFVQSNVSGQTGSEFTGVLRQLDTVMRELPATISSGNLDFSDPEALRGSISNTLGSGAGNANVNPEIQSRISTALDAIDPDRLFKEVSSNPQKLVEELIKGAFGDLTQVLENVSKGLEGQFNQFGSGLAQYTQLLQKQGEAVDKVASLRLNSQRASATLRAARTGRSPEDFVSLEDIRKPIVERQTRLAGANAFNPGEISNRIQGLYEQRQGIQTKLESPDNTPAVREGLQKQFATITSEAVKLQEALGHLADSSEESAAIQEKLNEVEKQRQGQLSFTEKLLTANPQQRRDIQRNANVADVAVRQGSFAGFNDQNISRALEHLRSLQDVKLPAYGNRTGGQTADELLRRATPFTFGRGAIDVNNQRNGLLEKQVGVDNQAVTAQTEIAKIQEKFAGDFLTNLNSQNKLFLDKMDKLISEARVKDATSAQQRAQVQVQKGGLAVEGLKKVEGIAGSTAFGAVDAGKVRTILAHPEFNNLRTSTAQIQSLQAGRTQVDKNLNEELQNKGTVFGADFGNIDTNADKATTIANIKNKFTTTRPTINAQTGLTNDRLGETVLPNLLQKVEDYFNKDKNTRPASFNINQGLIESTRSGFFASQGEAEGKQTEARRQIGAAAFGNELGNTAPAQAVLSTLVGHFDELNTALSNLPSGISSFNEALVSLTRNQETLEAANAKVIEAKGHADGGVMFAPRGTDTVPAMLTPGEFVVNAAATRANLSLLHQINGSGPAYYENGGEVDFNLLSPQIRNNKKIPDDIKRKMVAEQARQNKRREEENTRSPYLRQAVANDKADANRRQGLALEQAGQYGENRNKAQDKILEKIRNVYNEEGDNTRANRTLNQINVGSSETPNPTLSSKQNQAYFSYFNKAIDFYKGKKNLTRADAITAARNRQQLQLKLYQLRSSNASPVSIVTASNLLNKFDSSDIGQLVSKTQDEDTTKYGKEVIGNRRKDAVLRAFQTKQDTLNRTKLRNNITKQKTNRSVLRDVSQYKKRNRNFFESGGLVPTMVSPGEFIVNAQSAKSHASVLSHINSSRGRSPLYRASGGPIGPAPSGGEAGGSSPVIKLGNDVKSTLDGFVTNLSGVITSMTDSIGQLKNASDTFGTLGRTLEGFSTSASALADQMGGFNDAATSLAKSLAGVSIPPKIEMTVNGNYNVVLNGGNIFNTMTKAVAEEVKNAILQQLGGEIQKAINNAPPK